MQLCLIHNDPTSTVLMTPDGEALYSIETPKTYFPAEEAVAAAAAMPMTIPTPHVPPNAALSPTPSLPSSAFPTPAPTPLLTPSPRTTTIKRLERYHASRGHVETEVGVVQHHGDGTRVRMCDSEEVRGGWEGVVSPLEARMVEGEGKRDLLREREHEEEEEEEVQDNSWEFTGPDQQRYKWMFLHAPVLILNAPPSHSSPQSQSQSRTTPPSSHVTPLARYRRAKLGIISRSRRAFLEILPAGLGAIDFIVLSFVAFMRARVVGSIAEGGVGEVEEGFSGVRLLGTPSPPSGSSSSSSYGPRHFPQTHKPGASPPPPHVYPAQAAEALATAYWAHGYASPAYGPMQAYRASHPASLNRTSGGVSASRSASPPHAASGHPSPPLNMSGHPSPPLNAFVSPPPHTSSGPSPPLNTFSSPPPHGIRSTSPHAANGRESASGPALHEGWGRKG